MFSTCKFDGGKIINYSLDIRANNLGVLMILVAGGLADRSPVPAAYCRQQSNFILLSKPQGTFFQRTYFWLDRAIGGAVQADDISGDADDPAWGRGRRQPSGRLLSCGRGNGATAWRSNSRRYVRPTLSGRRERPEVLRVLLQGRRSQQAVQVRRPEVQQPVQMRAKVLVHVRYRPESRIGAQKAPPQGTLSLSRVYQ